MDIIFLNANLSNPATLVPKLIEEWQPYFEWKAFKEYDTKSHKVMDPVERKDKIVSYAEPSGATDGNGDAIILTRLEKVARLVMPIQKRIVKQAATFLTAGGVELTSDEDDAVSERMLAEVKDVWKKNKLRYKNGEIARTVMSQLECAEVWYSTVQSDGKVKLKSKIYKPSEGWNLIPTFDEQGDLIAFSIMWDNKAKRTRYMDIYTADMLRRLENTGNGWQLRESTTEFPAEVKLNYGKIPVIYYYQPQSEWDDVQTLIDRAERVLSNHADTNDYSASPPLLVKGEIKSMAAKGEAGKLIEMEGEDPDMKYVEISNPVESVEFEINMLLRQIYSNTQTADLSFEALKGLGNLSGVAFQRILMDCYLKAEDGQTGWFGECIQRRINFLVAALSVLTPGLADAKDLDITPVFGMFKIDDEAEKIANMMKANGGRPLIDHLSSIQQSGLTDDPQATLDAIKAQQAQTNSIPPTE